MINIFVHVYHKYLCARVKCLEKEERCTSQYHCWSLQEGELCQVSFMRVEV